MKLSKVKRLDSIRLDAKDKTYFTEEGYLVDHPILTSCGIFEYINDDGSIRRELRLPEHVFAKESLETYKGKPIIITHDGGYISKDNVDKEQVGTIMTAGYQDGNDVRAEIIIHDTDAMKKSGLKELSLGYDLDLIEQSGEWNGEPYDAIQTNIVINHLALVASARAGEQARLNIDSRDRQRKGGTTDMARKDSDVMSSDELDKKIADWKARKEQRKAAKANEDGCASKKDEDEGLNDDGNDVGAESQAKGNFPFQKKEEGNGDNDDLAKDGEDKGSTPEDIVNQVKERRDRRDEDDDPEDTKSAMGVIAQQDSDIDMLLACLEKFLMEEKEEEAHKDGEDDEVENNDSSDDKSKSLNADSADEIFRQRLSICRVGDKLHMDGLESKSILDGKKAIINKVIPSMRLDGKSSAYIDAAYDLAVGEVNKRKDTEYQRRQMSANAGQRFDNAQKSMALTARENMINREQGGNE